jgi:hypothetical protein
VLVMAKGWFAKSEGASSSDFPEEKVNIKGQSYDNTNKDTLP